MLTKIDVLIYNIIAFICFLAVLIMQYAEAVALVDKFGNIFGV